MAEYDLGDFGLVVADVPWAALLEALRATGEGYDDLGPVADWREWLEDWRERGSVDRLLAGELEGRAYVYDPVGLFAGIADRVPALAARTGGFVLAYDRVDTLGTSHAVAAQGERLLRYVADYAGHVEDHVEGEPLPGETSELGVSSTQGLRAVLRAHGFDVDGWLERGDRWDVRHTMFDAERQREEYARLYFGPLRRRVAPQEDAFLRQLELDEEGDGGSPPM